jgi:regulator of protease activity HflC (stomatin/prohibitin superfamily)
MRSSILILFATLLSGCGYWPPYNVWSTKLDGEAQLASADSTRKIAVLEAQAKRDSATLLAQAEVERAKGVAQANAIIGESLKRNDSYSRYLWITEVAGKDVNKIVVYVPTEANIPLGEAGRLTKEAAQAAK